MLGRPIILMTMTGRRSGNTVKVPVMREHGGYLAVASKGGAPEHLAVVRQPRRRSRPRGPRRHRRQRPPCTRTQRRRADGMVEAPSRLSALRRLPGQDRPQIPLLVLEPRTDPTPRTWARRYAPRIHRPMFRPATRRAAIAPDEPRRFPFKSPCCNRARLRSRTTRRYLPQLLRSQHTRRPRSRDDGRQAGGAVTWSRYLRSSARAMVRLWTSSGPSARRSVRTWA